MLFRSVKKALGRHGIEADSNLCGEVIIEADDNGYKVNGRPATTIGELLDIVNNLI